MFECEWCKKAGEDCIKEGEPKHYEAVTKKPLCEECAELGEPIAIAEWVERVDELGGVTCQR